MSNPGHKADQTIVRPAFMFWSVANLYDSGIIVQKVLVTQFRRIGVTRGYLGSHIDKDLFDVQAAKSFSVFNLLIELLHAVEADQPYHTVFQRLYAGHRRFLWKKLV